MKINYKLENVHLKLQNVAVNLKLTL